MNSKKFDVIVVGAGHAGAEAAAAAAHLGSHTLLITQNLDTICQMSCNPAMGGVAKGQIVREVDALGGMSGIVTDSCTLQFRMLNLSKGPAMWSPRAQCDKQEFSITWRQLLENIENLSLWQDEVVAVQEKGGKVVGVSTRMGIHFETCAVVLTNGTFLNGQIFLGEKSWTGGRIGEPGAYGLSKQLMDMGFLVSRLKTGTPVRIDGRTIDFSQLVPQLGDEVPQKFSFSKTRPVENQMSCFLAYTNLTTHDILRSGFDRSPMYTGRIQGHGPRYCPSIEDKIVRFADKERHQLFVEPEGRRTNSYYLNGFSSSLPLDVQIDALHSIHGFENARIFKPGYAIEYDFFPPTQLNYTLETKLIENLFFAGQINGTTGYEEAACQGLIAGINAALRVQGRERFVLNRTQAYIGVLIDDLVSKGVDEPYRMFTSRAEYRILLRQDNADERLTPLSHAIGLAADERMKNVERKLKHQSDLSTIVEETSVVPGDVNQFLTDHQTPEIQQKVKLVNLLLRPELGLRDLLEISSKLRETLSKIDDDVREFVIDAVEIQQKYRRYIEKERDVADRLLKFENIALPAELNYYEITALSYEAREKLTKIRPATLGQASRISGVSPADVSVLLVFMSHTKKI